MQRVSLTTPMCYSEGFALATSIYQHHFFDQAQALADPTTAQWCRSEAA